MAINAQFVATNLMAHCYFYWEKVVKATTRRSKLSWVPPEEMASDALEHP
jgi:hypothetical protein